MPKRNFKGRRRAPAHTTQKAQSNLNTTTTLDLKKYDQCEICFGYMAKEAPHFGDQNLKTVQNMQLQNCGHRFHSTCIKDYLKFFGFSKIEENISQQQGFECPMEDCGKNLSLEDIGSALEVPNLMTWLNKMRNQCILKCKIPYCQQIIVYNKQISSDVKCPSCKVCYDPQTKEIKLDQENIDQLSFLQNQGFIKCYNCHFWIQKNGGCNHMTCKCRAQMCYKCGGKYGSCFCNKDISNGEVLENFVDFIEQ